MYSLGSCGLGGAGAMHKLGGLWGSAEQENHRSVTLVRGAPAPRAAVRTSPRAPLLQVLGLSSGSALSPLPVHHQHRTHLPFVGPLPTFLDPAWCCVSVVFPRPARPPVSARVYPPWSEGVFWRQVSQDEASHLAPALATRTGPNQASPLTPCPPL